MATTDDGHAGEKTTPQRTDSLGAELSAWVAAIPGDVDRDAEALRQRIGRLSRQFDRILAQVAERNALSTGDWEALSVLVRSGGEQGMTPGGIGEVLGVTSGTVTVRIDRLVEHGLVERCDAEGRSRPVRLTAAGREAWGRATVDRLGIESAAIRRALPAEALREVNRSLGALLAELETMYGPAPRHDMTRGARRK